MLRGVEGDHRWFRVLPPVLVCAALWGSAFPGIKMVYGIWEEQGSDVGIRDYWWFAGVRFTLAGLMLLAVARDPWAEFAATPKGRLAGFAFTQTFGQYLVFYLAIAVASGSLAGLLSSAGSFWWMILAPTLAGVPWPSGRQWLALAIGAAGLVVATAAPGAGTGNPWLGALLLVISTGFGTWGLVRFVRLRATIGARAATGFSLLGGGLALLAVGATAFPRAVELMPPTAAIITLWLAFVSAAAFALWNHLSTRHPVPLLAGYRFLIPLAGMFESLIFLPEETAGPGLWAGAGLVVAGMVLAQRWR